MITRRNFIKKGAVTAAFTMQGTIPAIAGEYNKMKEGKPKKGLVIWYSQAGHTRRYGKYIAKVWKKQGLQVKASDYRDLDKSEIINYDIIVVGSPVYYYDVPENLLQWLKTIPEIKGVPVAGYSTFGGKGDGQHNTACRLVEHLVEKGGVPVGIRYFGNMSTFAMTWSMGNSKRILQYKHLPNKETYQNVKDFALNLLRNSEKGITAKIEKEFEITGFLRGYPSIKMTKWMVGKHYFKKEKCIECGTCEKVCPVKAISVEKKSIDTKKCILCVGCVNNCPVNAMGMTFLGSEVYGFKEFLKKNKIDILDPDK